jgi:parallel beta-helix repeat protein
MGGIFFENYTDGVIEKNICVNCEKGVKIKNESSPEVENNYINNCNVGLMVSHNSSPIIAHNDVIECIIGIYTEWVCHPTIIRNVIISNSGLVNKMYQSPLEIHYNNLNCYQYAIQLIPHDWWYGGDLSGENNYFYTTDEDEIQALIYDKNDITGYYVEYTGVVNYKPFERTPILSAGILDGK